MNTEGINEHTLQADLFSLLRANGFGLADDTGDSKGVLLKHSDYITSGYPDFTTTRLPLGTAWWEIKWATPRIKGTGLQHLTARRLACHGTCWYIVYEHTSWGLRTCLVRPKDVGANGYFTTDYKVEGINHPFVLEFIKQIHATRV